MASPGSLTVAGTGIQLAAHLTPQARAALEGADEVVHLVSDPAARAWLQKANPNARSLHAVCSRAGDDAWSTLIDELLAPARAGRRVCAAFDGHPGVFVGPAHDAVRRARDEGLTARMLPAVSSLDCLFADLGIDPGASGCQIHQATEFLLRRRTPDTASVVILLQISAIGRSGYVTEPDLARLPDLIKHLRRFYPDSHEAIMYEAAPYPLIEPAVVRVPLAHFGEAGITALATLVLPPAAEASVPTPP